MELCINPDFKTEIFNFVFYFCQYCIENYLSLVFVLYVMLVMLVIIMLVIIFCVNELDKWINVAELLDK